MLRITRSSQLCVRNEGRDWIHIEPETLKPELVGNVRRGPRPVPRVEHLAPLREIDAAQNAAGERLREAGVVGIPSVQALSSWFPFCIQGQHGCATPQG